MIEVLRLGHRPQRDKRITTHVCLTARALGASRVRISEEDASVRSSVQDVADRFGGNFVVEDATGWKGPLRQWKAAGGQIIHLTMYGQPLHEGAAKARAAMLEGRDTLIVVGAEKVPGDVYDMADLNIGVGNQPHSEVAALALLMDRLRAGQWETDEFADATVRVIPTERGKTVEERRD